jgi:hypothetical protein
MSFQVSINDGTSWIALSDEPMGLVDANIKIYRDEQFSGIVSNIVSDLSFWGDGWDVIYRLFTDSTQCLEIPVRIEQNDCTGFFFEGIIFLADIELDISRCIAKCTISDNSLSSLLARNYDVKVPINSEKSIDGTALSPIGEILYNPFYTSAATWWPNEGAFVDGPFRWYGLMELYPYVMRYFTNNAPLTFQDDPINPYFSDSSKYFNPDHWRIRINSPCNTTGANPACQVKFNDAYGVEQTISVNLIDCIVTAFTPQRVLLMIGEVIGSHFTMTSINPFDGEWIENYCDRAMFVTEPEVAPAPNPGGFDRYIDVYFPWDAGTLQVVNLVDCTFGGITITQEGTYSYGPYNTRITSGKTLKNFVNPAATTPQDDAIANAAKINVSFADLQQGFGVLFNTALKFTKDGAGNDVVTIGQEKNFYETTEAFSIGDIYEIKLIKDNVFGISALKIGQSNTNPSFEAGIQEKADYVSNVCNSQSYEATTGFIIPTIDSVVKLDGIPTLNDETLYIAEKDPVEQSTTGYVTNFYKIAAHGVSYYKRDDWGVVAGAPFCPYRFQAEILAGVVNHPEIVKAYAHRGGDGFYWNGNFVPNTTGVNIKNKISFEAPISVDNFNAIRANPYQKIRYGSGLNDVGWVFSLEYSITTGMTKFELLTE